METDWHGRWSVSVLSLQPLAFDCASFVQSQKKSDCICFKNDPPRIYVCTGTGTGMPTFCFVLYVMSYNSCDFLCAVVVFLLCISHSMLLATNKFKQQQQQQQQQQNTPIFGKASKSPLLKKKSSKSSKSSNTPRESEGKSQSPDSKQQPADEGYYATGSLPAISGATKSSVSLPAI